MSARYAVLGSPIAHSLSPALHRAAFAASGRDATYEALEVTTADLSRRLSELAGEGYAGVNLTAPLKAEGLRLADEATPAAEGAGAANTLAFDAGRIRAHNTDGQGFLAFLDHAGVDPRGGAIAFLGGGGAVAGLVAALHDAGAGPITVVARSPERTRAAFAPFRRGGVRVLGRAAPAGSPGAQAVAEARLVVQGTPLGAGQGDPLPCPPGWVAPAAVAVDLLYHPLATPWIVALRARGVRAANGLGLLIEQARLAQEYWFGERPPRRALEEAVAWNGPFSPPPSGGSPAG